MIRILDEEGHPAVGELLVQLRDVRLQTSRGAFRDALRRLGCFVGYEAARGLETSQLAVTTPLGERTEPVLRNHPVLAPVLRAALPFWQGLLEVFRDSDSIVLGAERREGLVDPETKSLRVDLGYAALVPLEGRTLVYVDPMLATGSTLRALHPMLLRRVGRPAQVLVCGVVAYRPTLALLERELGADIVVASADDGLDEHGYIQPGLGDAGDLAFGPKARL